MANAKSRPAGTTKSRRAHVRKVMPPEGHGGLLDLRAFVIVVVSVIVAILAGAAAGLTAVSLADRAHVVIGPLAAIPVFFTTLFGIMTKLDAIVRRCG